jgi:ATP-dependent DNA ligase
MQSNKANMQNFVKVIKACQAAGGAGKKEAIKAALSIADEDTKALIWHALNPYLTYGVRKWEKPTSFQKDGYAGVDQFLDLLQALSSRSLTGNDASAGVTKTLSLYTAEQAEFLELVIEKDLKAGFSEDTYNKVHGGDELYGTIPTFEVMLADKCESPEEFLEKINFPCQADWKYDGQRTICIVRQGQPVEYRARSGKPMDHLVGTYDEDLANIRYNLGYDFVMDGESFASDFTETINAKKEGNQAAKDALRLRAFFLMPLTDWMNQSTKITMRENRTHLDYLITHANCKRIEISMGREVKDYADMVVYTNEVIDTHKQEGLILKNWDSVYQWDRSMDWCKVKRFFDVDARVTGFYMGRKKSRLEDTVGGLNIEGIDEKGRKFRCNVGSGFSDDQRNHIRDNWHLYDGSTAVITFQEMSMAKGAELYALRFPTVKQLLRDDKVVQPLEV